MSRFVDVMADHASVEIGAPGGPLSCLRVGPADPPPDDLPMWVIPVGEPDNPGDLQWVDNVRSTALAVSQAVVYPAAVRDHAGRWELSAIAVTGISEARARNLADGISPVFFCWRTNGLSVESVDELDERRGPVAIRERECIHEAPAPQSPIADARAGATTVSAAKVRPQVNALTPMEQQRFEEIRSRRAAITPSPWRAHHPGQDAPLELVGRIRHPPAVQPRAAYEASGPWNRWRSTPANTAFQAQASADIAWLLGLLEDYDLALTTKDRLELNAIHNRLKAIGEPDWVHPSPTAVHVTGAFHRSDKPGDFSWPLWDRELQASIPEAPLPSAMQVQVIFLESAPADVDWLAERVECFGEPGRAVQRILRHRPERAGDEHVISFPLDRSLGDLGVGFPGQQPTPVGPAQGFVKIPAGSCMKLTLASEFREDDFALLADLPAGVLNTLVMEGWSMTEVSLATVGRVRGLRGLYLGDTGATDAGLAGLDRLTELRLLDLSNSKVTDDGLQWLSSCSELKFLFLSGTQTSDEGLRWLSGLSQLETLILSGTRVTGSGMSHLSQHPNLRELHLDHCTDFGDEAICHLEGMKNLEVLDLQYTEVTKAGLEPLWDLPYIRCIRHSPPGLLLLCL